MKIKIMFTMLAIAIVAGFALLVSTRVASAEDERSGSLHVVKNCDSYNGNPGDYCTILSSNRAEIAPGSKVFYDQAAGIPAPNGTADFGMLDSNVVLYVGFGDWAVGRCTLNVDGSTGLCTLSDGVGKLAGFTARVNVSLFGPHGNNNYEWKGRYSFKLASD